MAGMADIINSIFRCFIPPYDLPSSAEEEGASSGTGAPLLQERPSGTGAPFLHEHPSGTVHDVTQEIRIVDLDHLIRVISHVLDSIKKKDKKPPMALSSSSASFDFWEIAAGAVNLASALEDVLPVGVSVVIKILEKWDDVSDNQQDCVFVLEEMKKLAHHVNELNVRPHLDMSSRIKDATKLIVEQSATCLTQMATCYPLRLVLSSVNKKKLKNFREELEILYAHMNTDLGICNNDGIQGRKMRLPKQIDRVYPEDAVGIEMRVQQVIKLLECESQEKAVAVILYGFGGIGKTTLAKAVFARVEIKGCKYSYVELESTVKIVELQNSIIGHLKVTEEEVQKPVQQITTVESGREKIGELLNENIAFIFIDNVLLDREVSEKDPLAMLLPWNMMKKATKLRLLITTRDRDVVRSCGKIKVKPYRVEGLPPEEAMNLLKKELMFSGQADDKNQLNSNQLEGLLKICGGVPRLLSKLAAFIRFEEDKPDAYDMVMEDKSKWYHDCNLFDFDRLPESEQESFLDICSFFIGWPWNEVQKIVGMSNLNMLEKKSLVIKDTQRTAKVHDVILTIGRMKAEGNRLTLSGESETEKFLKKDIQGTKGLRFKENRNPFSITSTKLDSMCDSLKILSLGKSVKVEGDCKNVFKELVFFEGEVSYFPFNMSQSLKKLTYLEFQPRDLKFLTDMPSNLKHLKLDGNLHSKDAFEISSSDLGQLQNLRTLGLINFTGLKQLPEKLGDLKQLQDLTLSYCTAIEELPGSFSKLHSLKILRMENCSSFKRFPKDFESMTSLQELKLQGCDDLKLLPDEIVSLTFWQKLKMQGHVSLQRLLDRVADLRSSNLPKWINQFNDLPESEKVKLGSVLTPGLKFVKTSHLDVWKRFKYAERIEERLKSMNNQRDDISMKVIQGLLDTYILQQGRSTHQMTEGV